MKYYKAFSKGLICRKGKYNEKKYEENTVYEEDGGSICNEGVMHFCENPLDVIGYYPLVDEFGDVTEFAEVEPLDEIITDDSKKFASKKIKIGAKLKLGEWIDACVDFYFSKTKQVEDAGKELSSSESAQMASSGASARMVSSGAYTRMVSSGESARMVSSGAYTRMVSSGAYTRMVSSGESARMVSSGASTRMVSSGEAARMVSSGEAARMVSSGESAQMVSSGASTRMVSSGKYSVICCADAECIAKAKIGSWITLSEWKYSEEDNAYIPVCVKTERVDGERIKEDIWYKIENGEFVECE